MTSLSGDNHGSVPQKRKGPGVLSELSKSRLESWTQVSCPCCVSERIDPLVMIQLGEKVQVSTKKWLIKLLGAAQRDGGAALLAHPGEDPSGDIVVVSAPRCTLLHATEELGLCRTHNNGDMANFSYHDRDNFKNADDMHKFLTLAERQYIVKYELDSLRAGKELSIPGLPVNLASIKARDNIYQKLQKAGVIVDMFPLHEREKLHALGKQWYSSRQLFQPLEHTRMKASGVTPNMTDAVQEYFGDSVAFYFSFLDFYTWSLLPPALLGVALTLFFDEAKKVASDSDTEVTPEGDDLTSVSGHMIQAVFSMLWSTVVIEMWKRRSASLSYRWGSLNLAERFTEPRPGYHGNLGVNPVTGRVEPLFPHWLRQLRIALVSLPLVLLFLGMVVLGMFGFYQAEALVQWLHRDWDSLLSKALLYLPSLVHIIYTNVLGNMYQTVALALSEWENHREESAFQNHHTVKVLLFTFFNNFAVLFHIAFYKQDLLLLRKRLASLLVVTQLVNQVTEVVVPFIVDRLISAPQRKEKEDDPQADKLRAQRSLPPFPGLFSEYIELLVQFGYLSLFSCVYPLTAVLLLLNNLTEIRGDAFKICRLFRKPFSAPVADMGVWQTAFEVLSFVSVISNCWLLLMSPRLRSICQKGGLSSWNILLLAILLEHILILIKMVLAFLIPDEPDWVRIKREQIEFKSMQALGQQKL